jgi:hypothetical protein
LRESAASDQGKGMATRILLVLAFSLVLIAAPASAATGSAQVPEGSSVTLFALGLAGLLLGRRFSMGKKDEPPQD